MSSKNDLNSNKTSFGVPTRAKNASISLYREELIQPFKLSDSFNSTTLRYLIDIQQEFVSFWAKLEQTILSWGMVVSAKVERDIRTTGLAGEYVSRRVVKDTEALTKGVVSISRYATKLTNDGRFVLFLHYWAR